MSAPEETVAGDMLAAFVDRILRMKGEEDAIKSDIKEIYAEAKGMGYDKTRLGDVVSHVRKHEKDAAGEAEKEAIRDLYLTAYYRAKNKPHTHAPARAAKSTTQNASVSEPFDRETGEFGTTHEITEPQSAPQAAQMHDVGVGGDLTTDAAFTSPAGAEGIVDRQPIQPETANETADIAQPISATRGVDDLGSVQDALEMSSDGQPAEGLRNSDSQTLGEETAGVTGGKSAASNVSTLRQPKPLRPNCLKPDACGGQGRNHCWGCTKAMNEAGAA